MSKWQGLLTDGHDTAGSPYFHNVICKRIAATIPSIWCLEMKRFRLSDCGKVFIMPEIIAMPLAVALLVSLYFGTVFLIRITGAIFSTRRRSEIRSRPLTHFLMFCMIPTSIGLVLMLHPWPIKIYEVRRQAYERIENAGGLDAIKRDCLIIANESSNREPFLWLNFKTNSPSLPTAIAALKPIQVIADAPEVSGVFVPNVRIHILGLHSTDNSWPEYWLWFVKGDVSENSLKQIGQHTRHEEIRILTNSIYELIQ